MTSERQDAIELYLRTGRCDRDYSAWPGRLFERGGRAREELRGALVAEVRRLAGEHCVPERLVDLDVVAFTRRRVEPMVRGLFPRIEQETVLAVLERSTVFLTSANLDEILRTTQWDKTAWDLANLYLASIDADLLGEDAPRIVGLSEETTFYVSSEYFDEEDPFADFVVHEAAHVFHNCKRRTIGLRETRRREWLLDIAFRKRETFAYACEAYGRIVERAPRLAERAALAAAFARERATPGDERVDRDELVDIVREASAARNGWKRILARCAAPPPPTRAEWLASLRRQPDVEPLADGSDGHR
jgi:hypothetical protein